MNNGMLTQAKLKEILHYNPETGVFTWLVRTSKNTHVGDIAGRKSDSRWQIGINKKLYSAHRLAWLYMTGAWPKYCIDHIDGNPSNNAISNLRDVSQRLNMQNQKRAQRINKIGLLGVSLSFGKYVAQINIDGKKTYLGRFDTPEAAHAIYIAAKRQHQPGCTI